MAAGTRRAKESHNTNSTKASDSIKDDKKQSKGDADESKADKTSDSKENAQQPLGPPPRPSQNNDPDYFNNSHGSNNNHPYQSEPNPFEAQFGQPSSDTPGKLGLPPVAALTSPSSLMPGDTPGWNSLRSGPLSPAMLAGPTSDYFDSSYSRSFPTPNESGLRTGLTPGGGGSMFPAPSPNSQAIFNSLQLGANTPNTLEFLRTGLSAKAATNGLGPTSQPTSDAQSSSQSMDLKMPSANATPSDAYAHPDADAANGLFMLAQANGARSGTQFAVPSQPNTSQAGSSSMANAVQPPQGQSKKQKNSIASSATQNDGASSASESEEEEEEAKPATRSRGKKPAETKAAGNRRKAGDTPVKTPASKKQKTAQAKRETLSPDEDDDDDEMPTHHKDGKKMTDEEKRKNFLERNRVAALKCRQRKKQWLANLQNKCDLYSQENDALTHTVNQQREQILQLKQLLIQHKDCPITMQQGISPQAFTNFLNHDVQLMPYIPTSGVNGSVQGVPMIVDGRQGPNGQVLSRP